MNTSALKLCASATTLLKTKSIAKYSKAYKQDGTNEMVKKIEQFTHNAG